MLKLFKYLKPYWWQTMLLLGTIALQVWAGLQLPAMMANIINHGIVAGDLNYIWLTGIWMIGFALLASLCAFIANFLSAWLGARFIRDVRHDFFAHVLSLSIAENDQFSTASLITRTMNDIFQTQQAVTMSLSMGVRAPLTCILAIGQAIATAPDMTWIIALAVGVILGLTILIMSIVMPKFQLIQKLADRLTLLTRENLTGLRVIRAFNNEDLAKRKFERANEQNAKLNTFVDAIMSLENPLISLVFNGTTLLCIWIGISLITTNFAYLGNMMAFMQYAIQVVMSFLFLTMLFVVIPRASVSAKRVNEVLETKTKLKWREQTLGKPDLKPSVEFSHVDFAYSGAEEKVLQDISFVAKAGETTAFIGSTGSGKSTLINLVPRFYEATGGEIKVNGISLKDYAKCDLMRRIGYVPQRGVLFAGTIKSNILFGAPEASDEQLKLAARVSQSEEFIEKMDKKYDSHIAQGGTNVSGGQRQRLSIARAIAKDPDIYIFDDSFSALDMKTDVKLRHDLKPITKNAVTLIVAQRISTIQDADQIVVLDKGKVVGKGKHLELLDSCKVYREIAKSQLSDQEFNTAMSAAKKEGQHA
jgi:ATP-binding cassette subfamily B protein